MPTTTAEVEQQVLWCNSNICVNGKIVINQQALRAGLVCIQDIIMQQGTFLEYADLDPEWKKALTWLDYLSILQSLPSIWLQLLCRARIHGYKIYTIDKVADANNSNRMVYDIFISNKTLITNKMSELSSLIGQELTTDQFMKYQKNISSDRFYKIQRFSVQIINEHDCNEQAFIVMETKTR